jgi:hypothetical protein
MDVIKLLVTVWYVGMGVIKLLATVWMNGYDNSVFLVDPSYNMLLISIKPH